MIDTIRLKQLVPEDFVNYEQPSLFLGTCQCDWKCCTEQGLDISICQNSELAQAPVIELDTEQILALYLSNPITKAVVIGGLEPFMQIDEILSLIDTFRKNGENCPFVIYTGYYPQEIQTSLIALKSYSNVLIKYGRYIPNDKPHYDEALGVNLASLNQWAEKIS